MRRVVDERVRESVTTVKELYDAENTGHIVVFIDDESPWFLTGSVDTENDGVVWFFSRLEAWPEARYVSGYFQDTLRAAVDDNQRVMLFDSIIEALTYLLSAVEDED